MLLAMQAKKRNLKLLDILYEDNHLLVVNKPVGIATMGAESGPTVHSLGVAYLKKAYHKPGRVFLGIVSRLDAMTSGVLVLARTSKAASRLTPQFAAKGESAAGKLYLAVVDGRLEQDQGELADFVRKDDKAQRMRVVEDSAAGAKLARLRFLTLARSERASIVAVQLLSGRKHQIRLQFSHQNHALLGDRKYDSRTGFPAGIALHSWRLQIRHPTKQTLMSFEADLPRSWSNFAPLLPKLNQLRNRVDKFFDLPPDDEP